MKISLVMPIHNEEQYLPFSLPSIKNIESEILETIVILDNCTDQSEKIIKKYLPKAKLLYLTNHKCSFFASESFQKGFNNAKGDIILATGADIFLDPCLPKIIIKLFRDERLGTVCFRYLNYDLFSLWLKIRGNYDNIYKTLVQKIRKEARHTGFYCLRKRMMLEIGGLSDITSEYNEYCMRTKKEGWKIAYVPYTRSLHFRVGLTKRKQYIQGVGRYYLPSYNLSKTLFHSFIHLKPYLIIGFLHAKHYGIKEAGKLR